MSDKKTIALQDCWKSPAGVDYGEPIGCLATTYTFTADFYEEECLAQFLQMTTDPIEDGALYSIEREERMAGLVGAVVMVDVSHCAGERSLRWDLIPARVTNGIFHPKVSLLVWEQCVRLVVSSANLTGDGYRKNQEVVGLLDFTPGCAFPLSALDEALRGLTRMLDYAQVSENSAVRVRWLAVIEEAKKRRSFASTGATEGLDIAPIFVFPGRESALYEQIAGNLEGQRVDSAYVISPFFDQEEHIAARTVRGLTSLLAPKSSLTWQTTAQLNPDTDEYVFPMPKASCEGPKEEGYRVAFQHLPEMVAVENESVMRPLHAKALWLEGADAAAVLIGSSNFTSRGSGISTHSNVEANILYRFDKRVRGAYRALCRSWLDGTPVSLSRVRFELPKPEEESDEERDNWMPLPPGFLDASLSNIDGSWRLMLEFGELPEEWHVRLTRQETPLYGHSQWRDDGSPKIKTFECEKDHLPSQLVVAWQEDGLERHAYWPVIVDSVSALPGPEILRTLSLEKLIDILSSGVSLKQALACYLRQEGRDGDPADTTLQPELDPHSRVDTSDFLINRTRRISRAFVGLKVRLEQPALTEQSLDWRIDGPIGVMALAEAIKKHSHTDEERAFLLAELILELIRVEYREAEGCLDSRQVNACLAEAIDDLRINLSQIRGLPSELKRYCRAVLKQQGRAA